jgi:endonuclease YncB( thermonuclease family)
LFPEDELSSTPISTTITTIPIEGDPSENSAPSSTPTETQVLATGLTYAPSSTTGPLALDSWCVPWNTESAKAQVHSVIDGVTIEVLLAGEVVPVRYIGVDIPDYSGDPNVWTSATERNRELVEGKDILLIKDRSEVDSEGRLLRYALVGSVFVNRQLLESGYFIAVSSPPDASCSGIFQEAEQLARAAGRGLWAPTSTPSRTIPTRTSTPARTGDVIIIKIEPEGTIWQEPEEYVEIYNDGTQPVQLQEWTLEDIKGHVFRFPSFVLGSHQYCRVYTDLYLPEHCGFTYYSLSPIWDNHRDCAYLKDGDGILIDMYCYE